MVPLTQSSKCTWNFGIPMHSPNVHAGYNCRQYKLFQDFEAAIDSMLQAYLENNDISKKEFLQECQVGFPLTRWSVVEHTHCPQDSLNDTYCAFLDEDPNKVEMALAVVIFFCRRYTPRHQILLHAMPLSKACKQC